ncbi:twin-arginine translocase TatA/TatE family subunit [Halorientalis salina]|uniref:twin-arginine translocase TatA/TatE family subunit n=1 Tax=Halorientalis salina TaxID=2932266 RepID=UPI0010ABD551|nr:twin-arginine translocase TatA/TatE family subunit [Halorientalis salina]
MTGIIPLFPGIPGGPELIVILLIAILLFGANKIPELARSSGQAIGEFQKGREEIEEELQEMKEGETPPGTDDATTGDAMNDDTTTTSTDTGTEPQVESEVEPSTEETSKE